MQYKFCIYDDQFIFRLLKGNPKTEWPDTVPRVKSSYVRYVALTFGDNNLALGLFIQPLLSA